jgi:hypothetical protein
MRTIALQVATLALAANLLGGCIAAPVDEDSPVGRRQDGISGTTYTLWIHGRNGSGAVAQQGNYADFSYWGPADTAGGQNPIAVNWDGRSRIADTNDVIRNALDCFCTGGNACVIAAHSAGDVQIGYALDLYGDTDRPVTDGVPDATGACGASGDTQTGWNITWAAVAGGASGGTELADLGYWAVSDPLTSDLRTTVARTMYDHNDTQGVSFYHYAGASGAVYSGALPGEDDSVIAYHSSGALSDVGSFCNPGDWFCDGTLELGTDGSSKDGGTVAKWASHQVTLRDDGEEYDHYTNGSWGGIVGPMLADVAAAAGSM